jgi:hypothetical protein
MIRLQLVAPKPAKSPESQIDDARWVAMMIEDDRFKSLMESMGDSCIREWSESKSLEERERAFTKLQGLRLIESELQRMMDSGVRAAKVAREPNQPQ